MPSRSQENSCAHGGFGREISQLGAKPNHLMKTSLRLLVSTPVLSLLLATGSAQTVSRVASFAPTDSPESIAVDAAGNCYLSIGTGEIRRVTPAGSASLFATIPEPGAPKALGVKFDAGGTLYVASLSAVWKVTPAGVVSQLSTVPGHTILNDFALDRSGNVFVSDPRGFAIYKVAPSGDSQLWASATTEPLLQPRTTFFPAPLSVNGLAFDARGDLYGVCTQAGRLLKFPVNTDGSAGRAVVVAESDALAGADGLIIDPVTGNFIVAVNIQNKIAVVTPQGEISTLVAGGPLAIPTSTALGRAGAERTLYICNNGVLFPGANAAMAGVLKADIATLADAASVRLNNLSARGRVGTGADVLVAGFTIGGRRSKAVLIRGIGPTLSEFGVTGALADPRVDLYSGSTLLDSNDNWSGTVGFVGTTRYLGAFPLAEGSRDAALLVTLAPGSYTAQVSGAGTTSGLALLEIYEVP